MSAPQSNPAAAKNGRPVGKRYGEVLLVTPGEAGPQATVYNSFPLNDCPAELWTRSTRMPSPPRTVRRGAAQRSALLADEPYRKEGQRMQITKNFGGIEMILQATVLLSSMNPHALSRQPGEPPHGFRLRRRPGDLRTARPRWRALGHADLEPDRRPHAGARRSARPGAPAVAARGLALRARAHRRPRCGSTPRPSMRA